MNHDFFYDIHSYKHNLNFDELCDFCKIESFDVKQPASVNMWSKDWRVSNNTLPYILLNTDRFDSPNGQLYILRANSKIVGCSGVYISDFSSKICLAGVRTWINYKHRNNLLVREYFLPYQKQWAIKNNIPIIALSFNEYNKNIISIWSKQRLGEIRPKRLPKHFGYNGVHVLEFPVIIQHTLQYVIYELLDPHFIFDWTTIKA